MFTAGEHYFKTIDPRVPKLEHQLQYGLINLDKKSTPT